MKEVAATEIEVQSTQQVTIPKQEKSIEQIKSFLEFSNQLINPKQLTIYLDKEAYEIFYQADGTLNLALKMRNYDDFYESQSEKRTQIVWSHEIAHSVFSESLSHISPQYKKLMDVFYERRNLLEQIELKPRDKKLLKKLDQVNINIRKISPEFDKLAAYDELFADIFSVLYYDDPKAMSKALSFNKMSDESKHFARERDFTIFKDPYSFSPTDYLGHDYLWPARYEFWQLVKSCHKPRKEILKMAFNAIAKESLKALNMGVKTPQKANLDMIEGFKKSFICL